jgi:hypothetical protein
MEDRATPGLYLELGDVDPAIYAARAKDLSRREGAQRVTWWRNAKPGRDELPMRITDGTLLGVTEADEGFIPPDPLDGAVCLHFRRHRRPSQGILTGRRTTGLMIVFITPHDPARAAQLRDWADFVHIRHIAAAGIDGFAQISVYEHAGGDDPRFMHFYVFDGEDDAETIFRRMTPAVGPRLGGLDTDAFADWADWKAANGRLYYCNSFDFLGETS